MSFLKIIHQMDAKTLLQHLFTSQKGALPKLLYIGPLFLWLAGAIIFLTLPHSFVHSSGAFQGNSVAQNLQEDINLISQKAEKITDILGMSKKEMIQEDEKKSFIGDKMRLQVEKSEVAQSAGLFDKQIMVFDSALNRQVYPLLPQTGAYKHIDEDVKDESGETLEELQAPPYQLTNKSAFVSSEFANSEKERLNRLATAKKNNRKRRAGMEKSQTQIQAEAYERAIQENEKRYRHFYGLDEQGQPIQQTKTALNQQHIHQQLQFSTSIGAKDNLGISKQEKTSSNAFQQANRPSNQGVRLAPSNQAPLVAVIDQAQKIKSGDKLQVRIIEDGRYQGLFIPKNSILYGICQVQQDRILIKFPSINLDGKVLSAQLSAFDADGMEGIYVDGTFNDWTKEAIQEGLSAGNSLGIRNSLGNFSLKLGRKANNRVRVYVPGGYTIFLYESK